MGELDNGSANTNANPFPAKILTDKFGNIFSNVVMLAARDYHNIALKADGSVWMWGRKQAATGQVRLRRALESISSSFNRFETALSLTPPYGEKVAEGFLRDGPASAWSNIAL